ncbi:MAG: retropepsin-like aspartic protease [Alphaproteobacteria bacterium]
MSLPRVAPVVLSLILAFGAAGSLRAEPATGPADASAAYETALRDGDVASVRAIAADARGGQAKRALASAALEYWWGHDTQAGPALSRAASNPALTEGLHRMASIMLSGLRMRQSRYGDAAVALDAAIPRETDANVRAELEQSRAFCAALAHVPAMTAHIPTQGDVHLTRDLATLMRGPVKINTGDIDAIVDTGSAVSSIRESDAQRLGLHMLPGQVAVGTATSASATTKLAIADSVSFGGARFRNVVFLVMPDSALTFANGAYVIHAIIGLPLLRQLGRIEFRADGDAQNMHFSRTRGTPGPDSNLMLDGEQAFLLAPIDGADHPLRFFIDNGARTSHVNHRFVTDFPAIMASAQHQAVTRTGGAGSETQNDAMVLPSLTLHIGAATTQISNVDVFDDHHNDHHGDIGLDALRTGGGYVLDFNAMRVELLPTPP